MQPELTVDGSRSRQNRLLSVMEKEEIDAVLVTLPEHVQWLTGVRFPWIFQSAALLMADGTMILVAPSKAPDAGAFDEVLVYEAKWHSTLRNDQRRACLETLAQSNAARLQAARLGVEFSCYGRHWLPGEATFVDIEPTLYQLRRRKADDELAMIRKAISATEKMYDRAREIIVPGISELEVYNELQAAAVVELGEILTGTGNDYQCGSRGGPPRSQRIAEAGELYILDLGPAYRGYFADNARTIAVTEPDDNQQEAWTRIMSVFAHVETSVKPGKSARELFAEVQEMLDQAPVGVFNHHLGHGIGLFPHEAPHLNPHWDDSFEEGEVFTVEPGLYADELRIGMRIENDYLVTASGVEKLTQFALEL